MEYVTITKHESGLYDCCVEVNQEEHTRIKEILASTIVSLLRQYPDVVFGFIAYNGDISRLVLLTHIYWGLSDIEHIKESIAQKGLKTEWVLGIKN